MSRTSALVGAIAVSLALTGPLARLTAVSKKIGEGDFGQPVAMDHSKEHCHESPAAG